MVERTVLLFNAGRGLSKCELKSALISYKSLDTRMHSFTHASRYNFGHELFHITLLHRIIFITSDMSIIENTFLGSQRPMHIIGCSIIRPPVNVSQKIRDFILLYHMRV